MFAHPVNMFVASFVGSPAMSLIPLTAVTKGTDVVLTSAEGWELPLSPANSKKALTAKSNKVVLGARHSTVRLHTSQVPGSVPGKVYTVEPTGDVTFAQVFVSSAILNISLAPERRDPPGRDRVHRIRPGADAPV